MDTKESKKITIEEDGVTWSEYVSESLEELVRKGYWLCG